jgi:hypothetical protein
VVGTRFASLAAKPAQKREPAPSHAPPVAAQPTKVAQRAPLGLPAYARAASGAADATEELGGLSQTGGAPLSVPAMGRLQLLLGQSLAHVRVHEGPAAEKATAAVDAKAVTMGSHIYLGQGQTAHAPESEKLLAHEATHVAQHDQGRLEAPEGNGGVVLASHDSPTEHEAHAAEAKVAEIPTAAPPPAPAPATPKGGKQASAGVLDWVGDKIKDIEQWGEDKLMGLVEDVAPELATLITEGPLGYIQGKIEPAITGWVSSLTGGVSIGDVVTQISGSLTSAFALLSAAKNGDAAACDTLVKGIEAIRGLAQKFMDNPAIGALKSAFTAVSDVVAKVAKFVIGPAWELLKKIVGPAWDAIKAVGTTIQGWLTTVKNVAMRAFNWVAQKLGFDSATGEGGLMDWVEKKAGEVWDKIKETLKPVMGPLKVIAGVLLAFTGLPQIYLIVKYGPKIIEGIQWLWANRNNPEAVKSNPGLVGGTIFPKILGALQGFGSAVQSGASWLVGKVTDLATGALKLVGGLTGVPLLSMAQSFVQTLADKANDLKTWAVSKFEAASKWVMGVYAKISGFLSKYGKVLVQVALAVTNPGMIPIILAGEAWQWLPDCVKPPLIDLLLDAVLAILRGLPALPMLGVLWPLLKSGIIGFLEAFRGRDPATKIKVSNKLAKILSGGSVGFLVGFVKGFLKGVWDGIKMPFEAIWMVAQGIEKVGDFFAALGAADKPQAGQPAASPSHAPPPPPAVAVPTGMVNQVQTPATPPRPALPGVPSVITAQQAGGTVAGIAATLVRMKPEKPAKHEMIASPAHGAAPAAPGAAPAAAPLGGPAPNEYAEVASEAKKMGGELSGPATTVSTNFWPAVQDLFSGSGGSMSLDDLIAKLEKVWESAKAAIESMGGKLSNMITDFFAGDGAEEEIGNAVGYLVGMFAFQALLDYLSAGTWTGAMGVLSSIAKFMNWPMEFLGEAMAALKSLGGFILDGIKSLGSMATEAAGGALKEVIGAFGEIGTKLGEFAEELMAKVHGGGGAAEHEAAAAAEKEAATAAEKETATAAEKEGASAAEKEGEQAAEKEGEQAAEKEGEEAAAEEKAAEKAEEHGEALAVSRALATAEDAGHVPGPAIATSLLGLRARYDWIEGFEAEPSGGGVFTIYMIASKTQVAITHPAFGLLTADQKEIAELLGDDAMSKFATLPPSDVQKLLSLDPNVVEKLSMMEEGSLQRLASVPQTELARLAELSRPELEALSVLGTPELTKVGQLGEAELKNLSQISEDALRRFADLPPADLAKFGKLAPESLETFAKVDATVMNKFTALSDEALAKFGQTSPEVLETFGKLKNVADLEKFGSRLNPEQLGKFAGLEGKPLERLAKMCDNPAFPRNLENLGSNSREAIEYMSTLQVQSERVAEDAAKQIQNVRVNIGGQSYQVNTDSYIHVLERHHPEMWVGEIKEAQTFLPKNFAPEDLAEVANDVIRKNTQLIEDRVAAGRGAGMFPLGPAESHSFTWKSGMNNGRLGQLFPLPK